jgi:hypothetical protein
MMVTKAPSISKTGNQTDIAELAEMTQEHVLRGLYAPGPLEKVPDDWSRD